MRWMPRPHASIADRSLQILAEQDLHGFLSLHEQVAVDLVVIEQVRLGTKVTDLDEGARESAFRVRMEQQDGRAFQVVSVEQVQLLHQHGVRFAQNPRGQPTALPGQPPEVRQGVLGQIPD